jgi:hypothetical protein
MAIFKVTESLTYAEEAAADLTTSLNLFAKVDANGKIVLAGSGEKVLGTIFEVPLAAVAPFGPATVQFGGIAKVKAGAAVAAGARVQSDGAGKAITLAAGISAGIALVAANAANEVIPVALC